MTKKTKAKANVASGAQRTPVGQSVKRLSFDKEPLLLGSEEPRYIIAFCERTKIQPNNVIKTTMEALRFTRAEESWSASPWSKPHIFREIVRDAVLRVRGYTVPTPKDSFKLSGKAYRQVLNAAESVGGGMTPKLLGKAQSPLFEIDKPTLFVFCSGSSNKHFVRECLRPFDEKEGLDKYCRDMRLWDDDTVFGWYSTYTYRGPRPVKPGEYEYVNRYFLDLEVDDGRIWPQLLDPGTGSGGNSGFP